MKMVDDFLFAELPTGVTPIALAVEPKHGVFPWYNDLFYTLRLFVLCLLGIIMGRHKKEDIASMVHSFLKDAQWPFKGIQKRFFHQFIERLLQIVAQCGEGTGYDECAGPEDCGNNPYRTGRKHIQDHIP